MMARKDTLTPSLFDLFEEPVVQVVTLPAPIAETKAPEPVAAIEIPRVAAPEWPRDVAGDPFARRYEIGSSFVHMVGERSAKGWRASLLVTLDGASELGEPMAMSALHKTLGDAFGSVRHHALEKLRADATRIHGSFPPPKGSEFDDATALYWALGREDFRELADPEETIAAVAPVADPAPIAEVPPPAASETVVAVDLGDPAGSRTIEFLDWRVPGALARVRIFHPRPDTGETWAWSVEWSTGSSSEVEGVVPAGSRKDCITSGRSRLVETFSGIAIKGEAYTSRKAEYDRICDLYRLTSTTTPFNSSCAAESNEEMREAA